MGVKRYFSIPHICLLQINKQEFQLLSSLTNCYSYFTLQFIYYTWLHCTLQDRRSVTEDSFVLLSKKLQNNDKQTFN